MLVDNPPFARVTQDCATATDRQWLRLLNDAFASVSYEDIVRAGLNTTLATEFLVLVALDTKLNSSP